MSCVPGIRVVRQERGEMRAVKGHKTGSTENNPFTA
jgi:hypothetical protein